MDNRLIIERYLKNKKDVNCAVYARQGEIFVSEPEEAFGGGVYTFEEKYIKRKTDGKGGDRRLITGELREKIRSYAKTVYKRMNISGVVRMDFLIADNKVYLCEVNTVPGSLAYYLFCERISDARTFFTHLIEEGIEEWQKKQKPVVATGVLQTSVCKRK